ncbi:hypothetical protein BV898_15901 [Hypsibius exemplaris]|uniref:Uncharacterized protein n=1 Tax=Hypsibius exemplaris TaxID=2072580 RepID=A0A9X6NE16_HYPEX|nr:hypothetical protein BV898_15901 [Hypsibius exemplaris]
MSVRRDNFQKIQEKRIRPFQWIVLTIISTGQMGKRELDDLGQSRNKLDAPPHASQSWKKKRFTGDYFTIKAFGENPVMLECQQDAVPGFDKLELQKPVRDALNNMELKNGWSNCDGNNENVENVLKFRRPWKLAPDIAYLDIWNVEYENFANARLYTNLPLFDNAPADYPAPSQLVLLQNQAVSQQTAKN